MEIMKRYKIILEPDERESFRTVTSILTDICDYADCCSDCPLMDVCEKNLDTGSLCEILNNIQDCLS